MHKGGTMKKSIKFFRFCLFILFILPFTIGMNNVQAQYYTSVSTAQLQKSLYSVDTYSETIDELKKPITLRAQNRSLGYLLEQIAKKAGLGVAYNADLAVLEKNKSVNFESLPVASALQQVLEGTTFDAALTRMREIVLVKRLPAITNDIATKVADQDITGTVTGADRGEPLPGVNILVVGTNIGTSTDGNGDYSLTVPDEADSLQFSYIGYRTERVAIAGRDIVNVEMEPEIQEFDEMVVTALGITRDERSIGYATQKVEGNDITYTNEKNVIGSLAGKVAGVQVSGSSGASLGGTQTIKIRGVNSISGEGQPLIVVDGTPISNGNFAGSAGTDFGNLAQDINPGDIKSVDVMKGPAASSLYGIRGQYGVIMITTKKGSDAQGVEVRVNSSFSTQRAANFMEFQNTYGAGYSQDWNTLPNGQKYVEMYADESWGPKMDGTMVREYFSFFPQHPLYGQLTPFEPHPDNIKNFFEPGFTSDQGITVSGGGENSNYRLSFNDTRINGVSPNTDLQRNNLGVSAGLDASDQWSFSTNLNYAVNDALRPPHGSESGSRYFRQWFQRSLDMNRLKNYKFSDGTYMNWNLGSPNSSGELNSLSPLYWSNPYWEAYENNAEDSRNRFFGDVGVTFEAMPGLSFSGHVRGDMYTQNIEGKTNFGGASTPGYSVGKYERKEMNYELEGRYKKDWENFSLSATLGTNLLDLDYSSVTEATQGGLTAPGYFNIEASVDRPDVDSYKEEKKIISAYGLVSLGYQDTYFLDLSLRNDKSSTLPKDNNSYLYPSVSGSFVFSELMDWEPLSFGKLRASYAQAGSDLSPYQITSVYGIGSVYGSINTQYVPSNLNNPNIKPSFSTSYEAGVDLKFFGRVGLNFTYYKQENKNQVIPLDLSGTTGYGSATINAGLIENQGVEVSLNGSPVQTRSFTWNSVFNISRNRNEIVELHPDIDKYQHGSTVYSGTPSYLNSYEGDTFGSLVGTAYERDEATGKILLDDDNFPLKTDATHNFGSVLPDFTGGFQNVFNYKNWNLATMINFQMGGQFFSRSLMLAATTGLAPETAALNDKGNPVRDPVDQGGGVKIEGISKSTGEPVTAYLNAYRYYHDVPRYIYEDWVVDASYIKLSEVKLGYTFNKSILKSLPVKAIDVSLFANNPWMIWQEAPKGLDPSELSSGAQDITWYESGQLNTVRSYGVNFNLTF